MKLYDLQTLHMDHPAIDQVPCFSWKISSNRQNVMQERYRITVSQKEKILWDTGEIYSSKQSFIEYHGSCFSSKENYRWTVTVWNQYGESATATDVFETA